MCVYNIFLRGRTYWSLSANGSYVIEKVLAIVEKNQEQIKDHKFFNDISGV